MRPLAIQLPDAAKLKLQTLQLQRNAAEDAMRFVTSRLNTLPRDSDPRMRDAMAAEQQKQQHRFSQLSRVLSGINQWLTELRGPLVLEDAHPVKIELKSNETLNEALNSTRDEIKTLQAQLDTTRSAPLPVSDQKQLAVDYVAQLVRTARPSISIQRDQLKVTWHDDVVTTRTDLFTMLAWIAPELILGALEREIEQQPNRAGAMSTTERNKRVTELEVELDKLERAEQALIERAATDGIEVLQRPDVSPSAFLHVVVIKEAQAA